MFSQAGYSEGDVIALRSASSSRSQSTTTAGSATYDATDITFLLVPNDVTPDGKITVGVSVRGNANGDQIDLEVQNVTDGQTIISQSGAITGSQVRSVKLGPVEFTPQTTDSPIRLFLFFSNSDNTTSISLFDVTLFGGVTL